MFNQATKGSTLNNREVILSAFCLPAGSFFFSHAFIESAVLYDACTCCRRVSSSFWFSFARHLCKCLVEFLGLIVYFCSSLQAFRPKLTTCFFLHAKRVTKTFRLGRCHLKEKKETKMWLPTICRYCVDAYHCTAELSSHIIVSQGGLATSCHIQILTNAWSILYWWPDQNTISGSNISTRYTRCQVVIVCRPRLGIWLEDTQCQPLTRGATGSWDFPASSNYFPRQSLRLWLRTRRAGVSVVERSHGMRPDTSTLRGIWPHWQALNLSKLRWQEGELCKQEIRGEMKERERRLYSPGPRPARAR